MRLILFGLLVVLASCGNYHEFRKVKIGDCFKFTDDSIMVVTKIGEHGITASRKTKYGEYAYYYTFSELRRGFDRADCIIE